MRPYIICHMLSSIDGRIDGAALRNVTVAGHYEATGTKLEGDAWICGRTTMQQHFAEDRAFRVGARTGLQDHSRFTSRAGEIICDLGRYDRQAPVVRRRSGWRSSDLYRE